MLEDLPQLAALSDARFSPAVATLPRRFRGETIVNQLKLRETVNEIASGVTDLVTAVRIREIFPYEQT